MTSIKHRLLGLAFLGIHEAGPGLLIPRCRSIHTFGMRFDLWVIWVDDHLRPCRTPELVKPRSVRCCSAAWGVIEIPCGQLGEQGERVPD